MVNILITKKIFSFYSNVLLGTLSGGTLHIITMKIKIMIIIIIIIRLPT